MLPIHVQPMTRLGTQLHISAQLLRRVSRHGKRSDTWVRIVSSMSIPNVSESLVHDAHTPRLLYVRASGLRLHPRGQSDRLGRDIELEPADQSIV